MVWPFLYTFEIHSPAKKKLNAMQCRAHPQSITRNVIIVIIWFFVFFLVSKRISFLDWFASVTKFPNMFFFKISFWSLVSFSFSCCFIHSFSIQHFSMQFSLSISIFFKFEIHSKLLSFHYLNLMLDKHTKRCTYN